MQKLIIPLLRRSVSSETWHTLELHRYADNYNDSVMSKYELKRHEEKQHPKKDSWRREGNPLVKLYSINRDRYGDRDKKEHSKNQENIEFKVKSIMRWIFPAGADDNKTCSPATHQMWTTRRYWQIININAYIHLHHVFSIAARAL